MSVIDRQTLSVLFTLLIFVAIAAFAYGARDTLIAFLFAIFFAYLIAPLVAWLERWRTVSRGSRTLAIAEVYLVLAAAIAVIFLEVGPAAASEGRRLFAAAPDLFNRLASGQIIRQIGSSRRWNYETQIRLEHLLATHRAAILGWVQEFGVNAGEVLANGFWLILTPVLAVFFLKDGKKFADGAIRILQLRQPVQKLAQGIMQDINVMAAHYIRAQVLLAGLSIVAYVAVLGLAGVEYGIALGILAGFLEFIPVLGPLVGAIAILGVAFLTGFHHVVLLALFLGAWRIVQDYVNSPHIMKRGTKLHPLAVIFAVLAGGEMAGIVGVYLSIPIAATLKIFWRWWHRYSETKQALACDEQVSPRRIA
jgi:predicted PurR-regulated permease PerM